MILHRKQELKKTKVGADGKPTKPTRKERNKRAAIIMSLERKRI